MWYRRYQYTPFVFRNVWLPTRNPSWSPTGDDIETLLLSLCDLFHQHGNRTQYGTSRFRLATRAVLGYESNEVADEVRWTGASRLQGESVDTYFFVGAIRTVWTLVLFSRSDRLGGRFDGRRTAVRVVAQTNLVRFYDYRHFRVVRFRVCKKSDAKCSIIKNQTFWENECCSLKKIKHVRILMVTFTLEKKKRHRAYVRYGTMRFPTYPPSFAWRDFQVISVEKSFFLCIVP